MGSENNKKILDSIFSEDSSQVNPDSKKILDSVFGGNEIQSSPQEKMDSFLKMFDKNYQPYSTNNPFLNTLDTVTAPLRFAGEVGKGILNTASGGAYDAILRKAKETHPDLPPEDLTVGKLVGGGLGYAVPVAGMNVATAKLAPSLLKSALVAGGAGFYGTPDDRIAGAVLGSSIGVLADSFPKLFNLGGKKVAKEIAEKADKGFGTIGKRLGDKYEALFGKIGKGSTEVDNVLQAVDDAIVNFQEGENSGKLKAISDRLTLMSKNGEKITAQELQNLKQEVRKMIPNGVWNGTSDANAIQNAQQEIYFKINDSLEKIGGEEYTGLSREYRTFKTQEKLAKQFFYEKGIPSDAKAMSAMSETARKSMEKLSNQLPDGEKFYSDFIKWRRGQLLKKVAVGGGVVTLGDYLVRRTISGLAGKVSQQR